MPKGKQGGKREFVKLLRDRGDYTPFAIQEIWEEKEAHKEYSRLRNIVVKRLKRIEEVEPDAKILERWKPEDFKKLKDIKNYRELSHMLSDVAYLVNAKTASLTGRHEIAMEEIEKLKDFGIEIKSEQELKDFGEFMDIARDWFKDRVYDSERIANLYDQYHEKFNNIELLQAYNKWVKNRKKKGYITYKKRNSYSTRQTRR